MNIALNIIGGLVFLMNFKKKLYFSSTQVGQGPFLFECVGQLSPEHHYWGAIFRALSDSTLWSLPSLSSVFKSKRMSTRFYQMFKSEIQI